MMPNGVAPNAIFEWFQYGLQTEFRLHVWSRPGLGRVLRTLCSFGCSVICKRNFVFTDGLGQVSVGSSERYFRVVAVWFVNGCSFTSMVSIRSR